MVKIFVNGFGVIGRRVAYALSKDPNTELVGISKYTLPDVNNNEQRIATIEKEIDRQIRTYKLFVPEDMRETFTRAGYEVSGAITDAIQKSDLIVDAAKDGMGIKNKRALYEPMGKPAIFQGGEDRFGENSVADMIHSAGCNWAQAHTQKYVMQGSCNVTGAVRILDPLWAAYEYDIKRIDLALVRRAADLEDKKSVKDSIELEPHPHHGDDIKDIIPDLPLHVDVFKVPSRQMHMHHALVRFGNSVPTTDKVLDIYKDKVGVAVLNKALGTNEVRKAAEDRFPPFGDTHMVHIHAQGVKIEGDTLKIPYSDDQTGIVIPDEYMLIQVMTSDINYTNALLNTDKLFKLSERKQILEGMFA